MNEKNSSNFIYPSA